MLSQRILSLLLKRANDAQQTATLELGRLHVAERAELAKQGLLQGFQREVIADATAQQQEVSTTTQLKAPLVLLGKVELALVAQEVSVERVQHTRKNAEVELGECRKKQKRLEILQARLDKAQDVIARRREQKLNDEFATRSKSMQR
jgi:flagellar biosynthesis chaperone FliJ